MRHLIRRKQLISCVIVVLVVLSSFFVQRSEAKSAVPDKAAQAQARALIKELFGAKVAGAETQKQKAEVGREFLASAIDLKGDLAGQFVLLQTVRNLGIAAGDLDLAFGAISALDDRFETAALYEKVKAFASVSKAVRDDEQRLAVVEAAEALAIESRSAGKYDYAKEVASIGLLAARRLGKKELITPLVAIEKELEVLHFEYEQVKAALRVLESTPDDADANLAVGRFRCFFEDKWDTGMPMLALGSDVKLKEVALSELRNPSEGGEQTAIADNWYALYEQETDERIKMILRDRAFRWYEKSLGQLNGLAAKRAEMRIAKIREQIKEDIKSGRGPALAKKKLIDKWVAAVDDDGHVNVWNIATGEQRHSFQVGTRYARCLDFSPDGKRLAAGGYPGIVTLWDVESGKTIATHQSPTGRTSYHALKFSPDGTVIAAATNRNAPLELFDGVTGKLLRTIPNDPRVYLTTDDLAFSSNGKLVYSVGSDDFTVWDLTSGRSRTIDNRYSLPCVAASRDGRFVVTGTSNRVINICDGKSLLVKSTLSGHQSTVMAVAFHPDSRLLVSGSSDGTAKVWDMSTRRGTLNLTGHTGSVQSVAFSPSGDLIATGGSDYRLIIWDAKTGKQVRSMKLQDDVYGVAFGEGLADPE